MNFKQKLQAIWQYTNYKLRTIFKRLQRLSIGTDRYKWIDDHWHSLGQRTQWLIQIMSVIVLSALLAIAIMLTMHLRTSSDTLGDGFTPTIQRWENQIQRWSDSFNLDPNLVAAVMQVSSCGNPQMVGDKDQYGLFQVDEFEFREGSAMLHPHTNAHHALDRLQRCTLSADDNLQHTLACYTSGADAIENIAHESPETFAYVTATMGIYWEAKQQQHPTLNRWLNERGQLLCTRARANLETQQIIRQ